MTGEGVEIEFYDRAMVKRVKKEKNPCVRYLTDWLQIVIDEGMYVYPASSIKRVIEYHDEPKDYFPKGRMVFIEFCDGRNCMQFAPEHNPSTGVYSEWVQVLTTTALVTYPAKAIKSVDEWLPKETPDVDSSEG